ncbi:MAG: CYTH domain-containing protein [Alphaproteobacteria bacterium]|nr:CYTH domain-containing protein [Alphaproteobacteria bacterium]
MIEIELRFKISSVPEALAGFPLIKEKSQLDIYYDTADYALFRRGNFLRTRNNKRLEFKCDAAFDGSHDYCREVEFDVADLAQKSNEINQTLSELNVPANAEYENVEDFISKNNLKTFAVIDKVRREYRITDNMIVMLDDLKGLGLFIEAEIMVPDDTNKSDIQKYIEKMREDLTARGILGPDAEPVKVGYVELYLMEHNPAAYDIGQYKV